MSAFDNSLLASLNAKDAEIARLRAALEKIAFVTGGIDTPATSNAAHYEAVNALNEQFSEGSKK